MKDQGPLLWPSLPLGISHPLIFLSALFCDVHCYGLAFKAPSYLASSNVLFPWPLPVLFPPPRMHSQAHPHLLAFCPSIKPMPPPLRSLPNPCQEKNSHFSAGMRDEDPCGALLGLSVLISEIGKTQTVTTENRMGQNNLADGFSNRVHTPLGVPTSSSGVGEVKIILLLKPRHYLTFLLY